MRRTFVLLFMLFLALSMAGCQSAQDNLKPEEHIETFRDIPGLTEDEATAIEALVADRASFSYGTLLATESFILPDGANAGFTPLFCELLTGLFGVDFVPEILEWNELMNSLEDGEIDFTGELTPTPERKLEYYMTSPIAERMLRIFTLKDSSITTENDVVGTTLGFLDGAITAESILKSYPLDFRKVYVQDYNEAAELLKSGAIDGFVDEGVADPAFDEYDFVHSSIFFPMVHAPVAMTTDNPELSPMISAVSKYIDSGGLDKLYELYNEGDFEYAKYKLFRSFTNEEIAYIEDMTQRDAPVLVGYEHDNYPVVFYNEMDGNFEGIATDVLDEIGALTGLRFEPALGKNATWAEIFDKLIDGEIPMAGQLLYSEARKGRFLWSAVPYISPNYTLMSRVEFPDLLPHQVNRVTVGAMKDSGYADLYHELFPEANNLVEYDTQNECMDALEKGEIDLLMASEYTLLAEINFREKSDLKTNIKLGAKSESRFGYHMDETILASIIDKAQKFVPIDLIETSWTGRAFDYSKKMAEQRMNYMMAFSCVVSLILIFALFLFVKNLRLSKKLTEIANNDALTGIFNRRFFMELSAADIARSFRLGIDSFIIIFDLDHFKLVNDTHGHLAGDQVLRDVAQRVKQVIRPYDVLGRYGGEEFIILMTDVKALTIENVLNATERIRLEICSTPVEFEGKLIPVSASFGVAYAAPRNDMATATKFADEALYKAKEEGRNRVVFHEGSSSVTTPDI